MVGLHFGLRLLQARSQRTGALEVLNRVKWDQGSYRDPHVAPPRRKNQIPSLSISLILLNSEVPPLYKGSSTQGSREGFGIRTDSVLASLETSASASGIDRSPVAYSSTQMPRALSDQRRLRFSDVTACLTSSRTVHT